MTSKLRLGLLLLAVSLGAVAAVWQLASPSQDLAAWVPQGALLTIEAKDFSALLHDWNASPEQAAWLKSDNYAVFTRSHLFGRLQDAQKEFAGAAGLPVDSNFLTNIAGRESFFAWYDISNLQVVYLTKLSTTTAQQNLLLSHRKQFTTRQAGGITFYVKAGTADDTAIPTENRSPASETDTTDSADTTSPTATDRTVAFAISGDWLILATDENLMAQTLELMAAKDHTPDNALSKQSWYTEAKSKAPTHPGDLRMILNMKEIVTEPTFRTYWIQHNIAEMKHYAAAICDLTHDTTGLHEDRILLPATDTEPAPTGDLSTLTAMVPAHTVIYRATASPTQSAAVTALQEKVLDHNLATYNDPTQAPTADLSTPQAGTTTDFETRIDESTLAKPKAGDNNLRLQAVLHGATLQAMMTVDRNSNSATPNPLWVPFISAIILQSSQDWDAPAMRDAIAHRLQQTLTAGGLGTQWQTKTQGATQYFTLSDAHGLSIAFRGHLCLISDDPTLLTDLLQQKPASTKPQPATTVSAFDHEAASPAFAQWTSLVDGPQPATAGSAPPFFSKDLTSLSHSFSTIKSEQFTQTQDGPLVHQTIQYNFH